MLVVSVARDGSERNREEVGAVLAEEDMAVGDGQPWPRQQRGFSGSPLRARHDDGNWQRGITRSEMRVVRW